MKLNDLRRQAGIFQHLRAVVPALESKDGPRLLNPNSAYNQDGDLIDGARVEYAGRIWIYNNSTYEWVSQHGDRLRMGDAAQQEIMNSLGLNADGSHQPEFKNSWDRFQNWWSGGHGDFAQYSRSQQGKPIAKTMGIIGAGLDRLLRESGSGEGAGVIHIKEIPATVRWIEDATGLPVETHTLGSVGKKTWSGDIDIVVDADPGTIPELITRLAAIPGFQGVRRLPGNTVSAVVPIQSYQEDQVPPAGRPRTGLVQVDFMLGDPEWYRLYYHAPSEHESKVKGAHRGILLGTLGNYYDVDASKERTPDGRPLRLERYKWGSNGFVRIRREPAIGRDGQYLKKSVDVVIDGPWKDAAEISQRLGLSGPAALNSFESLWSDIQQRYPKRIVDAIRADLLDNQQFVSMGVPEELQEQN
jgi:hypothetical protein